jgi:hypothetical protein
MNYETNKHHFNWVKREWERDSLARRIRNHPGMIIPLDVMVHRDLHNNIEGIRPPIRSLANLMIQNLFQMGQQEPLIALANQTSFLLNLAEDNGRLGDDAYRVADQYLEQQQFLIENKVHRGVA